MADVNFSGISSGIDTASLIKALVEAKRQPINLLQRQATEYQSNLTRMDAFAGKLTALRSAATALASATSFSAFSTSTSDSGVMTVAASSAASEGNHSVVVQQLASGQASKSNQSYGAIDNALGMAGTLSFTPTGTAGVSIPVNNISIAAGDSLEAIRNKINNSTPTAYGSIKFLSVPVNGATVTVDGKSYEFTTTGAVSKPGNVLVDMTGAATGADAASRLAAAATGANKGAGSTMTVNGGVVTVRADAAGSTGNLIAMTETGDTGGAVQLSGASLSGGIPSYSASLINTGSASAPSWSLVLNGKGMGELSAFTASYAPTVGGDPNTISFANTQTARDSIIDIDGILGIRRSTNVISDVVSGVTLNLVDAPAEKPTISVGVAKDNGAIRNKVQAFITAYNDLAGYIRTNASYDAATKKAGPLQGDMAVSTVRNSLSSLIVNAVSGLGGNFNALSRVGIRTQADGSLSMDAAKFDAAMQADFKGVVDLFTHNLSTGTKGVASLVTDKIDKWMSPVDGLVANRKSSIQSRITSLNTLITQKESTMSLYESALKTKYANMEKLVSSMRDQAGALNSIGSF